MERGELSRYYLRYVRAGLGVNAPKHIVYRRNPLCDFVPCSRLYAYKKFSLPRVHSYSPTSAWSGVRESVVERDGIGQFPKVRLGSSGFDLIRKRGQFLDGTIPILFYILFYSYFLVDRTSYLLDVRRIISISFRRIMKWSLKASLKKKEDFRDLL